MITRRPSVEFDTATLQGKLSAGDITQEQYDEAVASLDENLDDLIDNTAPARGPHHGGHGRWSDPGDTDDTATSSI